MSDPVYLTPAQIAAIFPTGTTFTRAGDKVTMLIDGVPVQSWEKPS